MITLKSSRVWISFEWHASLGWSPWQRKTFGMGETLLHRGARSFQLFGGQTMYSSGKLNVESSFSEELWSRCSCFTHTHLGMIDAKRLPYTYPEQATWRQQTSHKSTNLWSFLAVFWGPWNLTCRLQDGEEAAQFCQARWIFEWMTLSIELGFMHLSFDSITNKIVEYVAISPDLQLDSSQLRCALMFRSPSSQKSFIHWYINL